MVTAPAIIPAWADVNPSGPFLSLLWKWYSEIASLDVDLIISALGKYRRHLVLILVSVVLHAVHPYLDVHCFVQWL